MVSVEDTSLRGAGYGLKQKIWNAARDIVSEWTGQELTQVSLYGIRRYKTGAILATHVDRLPLVSSAIINVAQDVDEPWCVVQKMLLWGNAATVLSSSDPSLNLSTAASLTLAISGLLKLSGMMV